MYDVLAMIKKLGIPIYFLTLSFAELRWEELSYTVNKSKSPGLSNNNIKNLSYQEGCDLLNKNPVLVAKHFRNNAG